ncbi:MAG: Holliday junction branch migration protein RuvA [Sphaerochaetaceae bacterium]|nr:Holliday junction branch migration protein RuvA [Sphaerochaetaceae bacterium]
MMINAVIGDIVYVSAQELVLRCGHIEYSLIISSQTASRLSQLQGDQRKNLRMLTWLQHREDSMTLFGFSDEQERVVFNQLQNVSGIGPKQALKILSGISVVNLIKALDAGDVKTLSRIPGIGSKTGQKLILALRNVLVLDDDVSEPGSSARKKGDVDKRWSELAEALVEMGYDKKKVSETLVKLVDEHALLLEPMEQHEAEETLFRYAIIALG